MESSRNKNANELLPHVGLSEMPVQVVQAAG